MITLLEVLNRTDAWLAERGIETHRLDAQLLLGHALGLARVDLYVQFERPMSDDELAKIRGLVARRGKREPLAWITGEVGFHEVELTVIPDVLVPRSDTEALVEAALKRIDEEGETYVADVGCGSGAVGLAIAHARPAVKLYATDLSPEALACTRANVTRLGLQDRVAVLRGDLLDPIPQVRPVDVVVSNPPYIPAPVLAGLQPEVRDWEPRLALDGGDDGLRVYRRLIPLAAARAKRHVLVEIGHDQGEAVARLFEQANLADVEVLQDLGGRDRVVAGVVKAKA